MTYAQISMRGLVNGLWRPKNLQRPSIPRRCGRQTQRENCPAETPEIYYRRVIAIPYVDDLLSGMEARFSSLTSTAIQALKLAPAYVECTFER